MKNRQNPQSTQKNKEVLSTCLTIGAIVLAVVLIVGGSYLYPFFEDVVNSFKSYDEYIEKVNYIDEEKDIAVLTYPSVIFRDTEELITSIETLKNSDGVKKVIENSDGSVTAVMSVERYEKIREAAMYAAQSLPYIVINEETAIRDLTYNDEYTEIQITVNKDSATLETEVGDIIYLARLYHICNMSTDKEITINYINWETGHNYMDEIYDVAGNKQGINRYYTQEEAETAPWKQLNQ